jgi:hypothetical protein
MKRRIAWESQHIEEEPESDEEDGYEDEEDFSLPIGKMMATPMWLFNVDDKMANVYHQFDIWMGHTNFWITEEIVNLIQTTPGVELLRIISPYRFIVAPGKMFNWTDVRTLITDRICVHNHDIIVDKLPPELKEKVSALLGGELKDKDYWRVYIFPNSEVHHEVYSSLVEYNTAKQKFAELKSYSNGIVITSE